MNCIIVNNTDYYKFPADFADMESLIAFFNQTDKRFIRLTKWKDDNCAAPYFIEEEQEELYVNLQELFTVKVDEITVLPRAEYDRRLQEVIAQKCATCTRENCDGDPLETRRDTLTLGGDCWLYNKAKQPE